MVAGAQGLPARTLPWVSSHGPLLNQASFQIEWAIWLTRSLEIEPKKAPEDKTFPGLESYRP